MKKHYAFIFVCLLFAGTALATGHTATTTIVHHVTCPGGTDGKAYVTVSGGVGPFTYSWNSTPAQTTDTLFNAPAGNYVCIITDQNDMSAYTATLTINPGQNVAATNNGPVCQNSGQFQLYAIGVSGFSWAGPNGFTSTLQNPTVFALPAAAGIYTVTGTSSTGCVSTASTTVNMMPSPVVTASANGVTCNGMCNGTGVATANGGTAPYAYLWTPSNMSGPTAGNLCAGNYTVMVTDANGCVATTSAIVTQPTPLVASLNPTQPSGCGACDGSIQALVSGGTPAYTYAWNIGSTTPTVTGLCPGTYSFTATDASGCSYSSFAVLSSSGSIVATVNANPDTCGQSVGNATAIVSGAQGPVTYLWMPGNYTTQSIFNVPAGTYSLTVHDTVCAYTTNVIIGNAGAPTVAATSNPASCGNPTGLLVITASGGTGPYQYSINGGAYSSNQTYNNMPAGTYTIICQDANGCLSTPTTNVISNTGMNVYFSTGTATCGNNNGASYAYTAGGGTAPYLYQWSNGATTQTVSNLAPGVYTCTITDATGCVATGTTSVSTQATLYQNWSCTFNNCGVNVLDATAQTGTGPFTYQWSPGGQTTPVITNQAPGTYTCTVTDQSSGCTGIGYYYVYNGNYSLISGSIYADLNGNCIMDMGENSTIPLTITAYNASAQPVGWASVNYNSGNYQMYLPPTAGSYTLMVNNSYYYWYSNIQSTCNNTITLSGNCDTLQNVNLGYQPVVGQDLHVSSYCGGARPGFQRFIYISYFNPGTTTVNATVKMKVDNLLNFGGSTPAPTAINGNIIEWNAGSLVHGQYDYIYASENVPAGLALGTPLFDSVWIEPVAGDNYVSDNYSNCYTTVTGSFDPNMKEAYADNMDASGAIDTSATDLYYTVHFQNTGTDTAFTIVVRDTLSSLLDPSSFEMIAGSHPLSYSIEPGRALQVRFDNILLPDSNHNEALSHGYFQYKIHTNPGLQAGNQIDNTAAIYFDFNAPVMTNTVQTPVQLSVTGIKNLKTELQAHVFPNPSNTGSFTIRINDASYKQLHFTLYNVSGMKVADKQLPAQPTHEINTAGLGSGIYFYQLINADGKKLSGKIILTN
jgi:hypothetical protein